MKLISKLIKNSENLYPGFIQGSKTDKDLIARSCGFSDGDPLCLSERKFEDDLNIYILKINYVCTGEFKIIELDHSQTHSMSKALGFRKEQIERALSNARKNKVSSKEDVIILSEIFENYNDIANLQCWIEGEVSIDVVNKESQKKETLVSDQRNSCMGISEVSGSLEEVHLVFNQLEEKAHVELLEWYLESI